MRTLDACVLIEETCASIYYAFAGLFADNAKFSTLWTEMAIEEESHAEQFRTVRAIHFDSYTPFDDENFLIRHILEHVTNLNENIKVKTPTLKDALITALILEKSIEKYHLETSKRVMDPELAKLLEVMVEYSHGHIEMLHIAADSA
ncbi:hypothetical protein [Geobacter sp. OR-1]|uniref:hypothetical protein n=1 Tax=Geobacter sp. OR-1 TaxID=1266765 RepID=UPI001269A6CF|nr:hypothetical protein [Geobacter sp. OR-1]